MNSAETIKVADWAKQHGLSPEIVSRLLQTKGIKVNSFYSLVSVGDLDSIRVQAVADQERHDKRVHAAKKSLPQSSQAQSSKAVETSSTSKEVGGKKLKVVLKRPAPGDAPPPPRPAPKPLQAAPAKPVEAPKPVEVAVTEVPVVTPPVVEIKAPVIESAPVAAPSAPAANSNPPVAAPKPQAPQHKAPVHPPKAPHVAPAANQAPSNSPAPTAAPAPTANGLRPAAPMKATITGPTPEMLARIQKHKDQQQQGRRPQGGGQGGGGQGGQGGGGGRPQGTGYTGSFGRSPGGAPQRAGGAPGPGGQGGGGQGGGQNRGPGGPNRGPAGVGGAPRPAAGNSTMADAMQGAGFVPPKAAPAGRGNGGGGGKGKGGKGGNNKPQGGKNGKPDTRDQTEFVRQSVNRVMASISKNPMKKSYRREAGEEIDSGIRPVLKTSDFITVGELAGLMEQMPARVIAKCMEMGMMVTINHRLDFDTIQVLADEFGFDVELMEEYVEEHLAQGEVERPEDQINRSPIVTVMGHVDHGKTSLLDHIRKANVVSGESGGITQHIGAYEVSTARGNVTFLDTPGHEAFTAMRTRGSQVTDVIVLVVAADSMVMPQTIEVIELARSEKVPIVVAITKCDLPTANPDKIRAQLAERGVEVEQFGGSTSCIEVSSRTGQNIDLLVETLALETEILDLKANPKANARGTVIESRLDAGKGAMATIIVQNGTLKVGDVYVCGNASGRVRAMFDERGKPRKEAGPSVPAVVIGFDETPQAGDDLVVFEDEKTAREIASKRRMAARERELRARKHMSLEQVYDRKQTGEFSELNLIVKADVDGSAEAIAASLERLTNKEVKINIIRKAVGAIREDDIMLASSADAVIIAFHLMPALSIRELAEREGIEIRTYRIIYEIIEDIQGVVEGMLKPILREQLVGEAEVREVFKIPKIGMIAGCMVRDGVVDRESSCRVYRDSVEMGSTIVQSLKRHKDDAKEVKRGMECGIGLKGFENLQAGDSLVFFKQVKVARTLADVEADAAKAAVAKLDSRKK